MPSDIWYQLREFWSLGTCCTSSILLFVSQRMDLHFASTAEPLIWRTSADYHAAYSLVITIYYILGLGMPIPCQRCSNVEKDFPGKRFVLAKAQQAMGKRGHGESGNERLGSRTGAARSHGSTLR
jgi:hypothetical protein